MTKHILLRITVMLGFLAALLLTAPRAQAQDKEDEIFGKQDSIRVYIGTIGYGQWMVNWDDLNNTIYNSTLPNSKPYISFSGYTIGRKGFYTGGAVGFFFSQSSQLFIVSPGGSVSGSVKSASNVFSNAFLTAEFGYAFLRKKNITIYPYLGIGFSSHSLDYVITSTLPLPTVVTVTTLRNDFIFGQAGVGISATPRIANRFRLAIEGRIGYNLSGNNTWRTEANTLVANLPSSRISGLFWQVSIGVLTKRKQTLLNTNDPYKY